MVQVYELTPMFLIFQFSVYSIHYTVYTLLGLIYK